VGFRVAGWLRCCINFVCWGGGGVALLLRYTHPTLASLTAPTALTASIKFTTSTAHRTHRAHSNFLALAALVSLAPPTPPTCLIHLPHPPALVQVAAFVDGDVRRRLEAFQPDLLMLSAGFDAHAGDPVKLGIVSTDTNMCVGTL
jgi:hypothetical protein